MGNDTAKTALDSVRCFHDQSTLVINALTDTLDATRSEIQAKWRPVNIQRARHRWRSSSSREPIQLNRSEMRTSTRVNTEDNERSCPATSQSAIAELRQFGRGIFARVVDIQPHSQHQLPGAAAGTSTKTPHTLRLLR